MVRFLIMMGFVGIFMTSVFAVVDEKPGKDKCITISKEEAVIIEKAMQEKEKLNKKLKIEEKFKRMVENLKHSGVGDDLFLFLAVRTGEKSICTSSCDKDILFDVQLLGKGSCGGMRNGFLKQICLRKSTQVLLSGVEEKIYQSLQDNDFATFKVAISSEEVIKKTGGRMSRDEIVGLWAYIKGFEKSNEFECENFFTTQKVDGVDKVGCSVLFGPDPEQAIDRAFNDIAADVLAQQENDVKYCDFIKDAGRKARCLQGKDNFHLTEYFK